MLFFNAHISRTGGLTLAHILRRNFGDDHLDIYTEEIKNVLGSARVTPTIGMLTPDELNRILDQNGEIKSISSHWIPIPSGIEILKERFGNVKIITFFRDPIDVIISKFFSFRRRYLHSETLPEHMLYDYRNDLSLFLKHWAYVSKQYDVQDQCRNYTSYFLDNDLNIDKGLSRLKNDFWFVGLTERFNEGLILLKDRFQQLDISFSIYYNRKNKGLQVNEEKKKLVTEEVLQGIRDQNKIDIRLYENIIPLYKEKICEYSGNMKKDLLRYKQKLAVWRTYHSIIPNVIKRQYCVSI